jgi:hypothetical protein
MFEEDEDEDEEVQKEGKLDKSKFEEIEAAEDESTENKIMEGKRWADGGFVYGYDSAEGSRQLERRRVLAKSRSSSKFGTQSSTMTIKKEASMASSSTLSTLPTEELSTGVICPVSEDVIAIHNRTQIKFVFIRTGKSRLFVPADNKGVGVIGGRDELGVLAWGDIGPPSPKIHVYRYADPLNITTLEGNTALTTAMY